MTDAEIRVAIAEKCGWTQLEQRYDCKGWCGIMPGSKYQKLPLPDYPNDLNAVHEAESVVFNKNDWTRYTDFLIDLVPKDQSPIRATAHQRCEALLRTWGIWKD